MSDSSLQTGAPSVVLLQPEIPQNTGNIARSCACTGAHLHLVEPMGFRLSSKHLGRAGLDYWDSVQITRWSCTQEFLEAHGTDDLYLFTGQAETGYTQVTYGQTPYLVFGRESTGIDEEVLDLFPQRLVRIPMRDSMRSLNLSNAVALGVYEVLRQSGFAGMV